MRSWNLAGLLFLVVTLGACTSSTVSTDDDAGQGGGVGGACTTDEDCSGGARCSGTRCIPTGCSRDSDCPEGMGCNSGQCGVSTVCSSNEQCPGGQVCVAGACATGCDSNDDCAADKHCENGSCLPGTHCAADGECPATQICTGTGVCVTGCRENRACQTGQVCVASQCSACSDHSQCDDGNICESGACIPGCLANADCQMGEACVDHVCGMCTANEDCSPGFACVAGACRAQTACANDAACAPAEHCESGFCISNPACSTTQDCSTSQTCTGGACTRNDTCSGNSDCSDAQQCIQGVCTWNPSCATSAMCPSTMGCVGGYCTQNPSCSTDTECPETARCVSGVCTRNDPCSSDAMCPTTQFCAGGTCTRNPTCNFTVDCAATQHCVDNTCTRNPACVTEMDCSADQSCVANQCTRNMPCTGDGDCTAVQSCIAGTCTDNGMCTRHTDCPATQFCSGNVCNQGPQCASDVECPANNHCAASRCEPNAACTMDTQCPREQHCESSLCTRNDFCEDGHCPSGQACFMGQCVQARDCVRDADCQDGTLCNGAERCDVAGGGVCVAGTRPTIDDGNPCTEDTCAPATGMVTHTPRNALCNDQNPCTLDSCDAVMGCRHDADPAGVPTQTAPGDCHKERCMGTNPVSVVDNTDVPAPDGIACTVEECVQGVPRTRLDGNSCQDGNACNGTERCVAAQGCRPPATPFMCPSVDMCHVGFCDPVTGCGSRNLDADNDGHLPTSCGGDDCDDMNAQVHTGHAEVAGDGRDNNCNGFVDEGFGSLMCPTPPGATPPNPRILDPLSLTATVSGAAAGTFGLRWSVILEPQANSLALQNANTPTVSFTPVIRGQYKLRARLTQTGASDQTCDVTFTVDGPDEDFNAQLVMRDSVDVDLHVLHPLGGVLESDTDNYFYDWNWGPTNGYSCWNGTAWYTCASLEDARMIPDCHWSNCGACTVTVPGQPACTSKQLDWRSNRTGTLTEADGTPWAYSYPFAGGGQSISVDANPKLDIDNQRGCYVDALGSRVCTPENISIKHPGNASPGRYTVAVHYWGEPVVQSGTSFTGNSRGVAPAGLSAITFDVEVFCKGVGFRKYRCTNVPVDGWCFVADAVWSAAGSQCSSIGAPTRTFAYSIKSDTDGIYVDTTAPQNVLGVQIQ